VVGFNTAKRPRFEALEPVLDERGRRHFALAAGRGGASAVMRALVDRAALSPRRCRGGSHPPAPWTALGAQMDVEHIAGNGSLIAHISQNGETGQSIGAPACSPPSSKFSETCPHFINEKLWLLVARKVAAAVEFVPVKQV
jgi:hypothetical protein